LPVRILVSCVVVLAAADLLATYEQNKVDRARTEIRAATLIVQYNLCTGAKMANVRDTPPVDVAEAIEKWFAQQGFECKIRSR